MLVLMFREKESKHRDTYSALCWELSGICYIVARELDGF